MTDETQNQNVKDNQPTEENLVSSESKREIVESVPIAEETPTPTETTTKEKVIPTKQIENQVEQVEIPKVAKTIENLQQENQTMETNELEPKTEEVSQTEIPQIEIQQPPLIQEPQTIEKIIYQTPPNFIQNLLNKARAKIQERKRKKLDKIILLFESNSEISNSDIQKLLRTTKRSATRYLNQLEKEQKITQVGNAGRSVKYIKKQ